jgi:hypothetical protein
MALYTLLFRERVNMKKFAIAGISILAVIFLVLCSQTSVVGYRVLKDSQQNLIKESVSKIKTNLLTLKSLFTESKPLLGGIYLFMAFLHFIWFFVTSVMVLWINTDHHQPYYGSPLFFFISQLLLLIGIFLISGVIALLPAVIWPLTDFIIYLLLGYIPHKKIVTYRLGLTIDISPS